MAVVRNTLYEQEYNCSEIDLVDGYPSNITLDLDSIMYAYNSSTRILDSVFKLVNVASEKAWHRIVFDTRAWILNDDSTQQSGLRYVFQSGGIFDFSKIFKF